MPSCFRLSATHTVGSTSVSGRHTDDVFARNRRLAALALVVLSWVPAPASAQLFAPVFDLSSLETSNGTRGYVVNGAEANHWSEIGAAGDVNGDGVEDLIIRAGGARLAQPSQKPGFGGKYYVVFGRPASAGLMPTEFELAALASGDGSTGFVLNGIQRGDAGVKIGTDAASGDINGDGIDDIIIGARNASRNGASRAGESYVVFGRSNSSEGFPPEFELSSLAAGDGGEGFVLRGGTGFGRSIASAAGDINGDGIDDVIVSSPVAAPGGRRLAGTVLVVYGRDTTASNFPPVLQLSSLLSGDGSEGFAIHGDEEDQARGTAVGDINGDGVDDVLISARFGSPGGRALAGRSYVVYGRDAAAGTFPATFELSALAAGDGSTGVVLNGVDPDDRVSDFALTAGDLNGDGIDDVVIGSRYAEVNGQRNAGEIYVVFGRRTSSGGLPAEFELSSLAAGNGSTGFSLYGTQFLGAGRFVRVPGDVSDDGADDLIVGSVGGEGYVVLGKAPGGGNFPATFPLASLATGNGSAGFVLDGREFSTAPTWGSGGDINGDGIDDLLVSSYFGNPDGKSAAGRTFVIYGRSNDTSLEPLLNITNTPSAAEGDFLKFTLALSDPSSQEVRFDIETVNGSAESPSDYRGKAGSRLIAAGETERTIWIPTVNDSVTEDDETMTLRISNANNADIINGEAVGTIIDNDQPDTPMLSVSDVDVVEGDNAWFFITLSGPSDTDTTIRISTVDGTATGPEDYRPRSGQRVIPAGETRRIVSVPIADDGIAEGEETLRLRVNVIGSSVIVADGVGIATISDR